MFSKVSKRNTKIIISAIAVIMVILLLVGNIYSAKDNHYVIDVVKETATRHDNNLKVTETIERETSGPLKDGFKSTELNYKVEVENIAQAKDVETQVAMVIDTSYSMELNDTNNVVKETAKTLADKILREVPRTRISISNNSTTGYNSTNTTNNTVQNPNMSNSYWDSTEYTANRWQGTINSYINNLKLGEGSDSNVGLDNAVNSFTTPINGMQQVKKYIVVFTDSTDNVTEKMQEIKEKDPTIEIITILVDLTSTSYIANNEPVCGDVYLLLSGLEKAPDNVKELDMDEICDNMQKLTQDIVVSNIFSDEILNYFDITDFKAYYTQEHTNGSLNNRAEDENISKVEKTDNGYRWEIKDLKFSRTATLTFKLSLRYRMDINAGVIFENVFTNKEQKITYTSLYNSVEQILEEPDDNTEDTISAQSEEGIVSTAEEIDGNTIPDETTPEEPETPAVPEIPENAKGNFVGNDSTTEGTIIKICQGYDVKIKAVNEANTDLPVEGIEVEVVTTRENLDGTEEKIDTLKRTTDSNGYITITADEARALRGDGRITYTVKPLVNKVGYTDTDRVQFSITNNKETKKIEYDDHESGLKGEITEDNRTVEITVPINSQKFDFELRVEELNNSNVTISGSEFELIQPKLNNKYEMSVLSGISDENGTIHFNATVMQENGTYNYILRQAKAPDGYDITPITLLTIKFKDGIVEEAPEIQFNPNAKSELISASREGNHTLITIGNENLQTEAFNLEINLSDYADHTKKIEGVTYLIEVTDRNNLPRKEFVTTDANGQINTNIYGNGDLRIKITEQSQAIGYAADTVTKILDVRKTNGEVEILYNQQNIDAIETNNRDGIIVDLYSKKKVEQNILTVSLVDADETDVAVGSDVVYHLTDVETGYEYPVAVSNRKGQLSFTLDNKEEGTHAFILSLDSNTVPDEYQADLADVDVRLNIEFDKDGYIIVPDGINTADGDTNVIDRHTSTITKDESVEYTAFLTIQYHIDRSKTTQFTVQLSDKESMRAIQGAKYNINIEWDIDGVTKTKTIEGRRTNASGQIVTRVVKADEIRAFVTQTAAATGYNADLTTQEIYVTYKSDGTIKEIIQTPYDRGETNTDEPNQGAYEDAYGNIIYQHLNKVRSVEDTYVNLTFDFVDMNRASVDGVNVRIKSNSLLDENGNPLDVIMKTGAQGESASGEVIINYEQHAKDPITFSHLVRVPGIGTSTDETSYDLEVSEVTVDSNGNYVETKAGTTTKWIVAFRYRDGRVMLTNFESIYGNRLIIQESKQFSSFGLTGKTDIEDELGVFLGNASATIYTNYDDIGNLSLDLRKNNLNKEPLTGAKYNLRLTNPDGTVSRKTIEVLNGTSDIELTGLSVNVGSRIELTEVQAPIGYALNEYTETFEVYSITEDGRVYIRQIDNSYTNPARVELKQESAIVTSTGAMKTEYSITFIDYQLDTFEFGITTKDKNTQDGIAGFGFRIDTDKGATSTLTTGENGIGNTRVGAGLANTTITYTIKPTGAAEYYKPATNGITVVVYFDEVGKVDLQKTMDANKSRWGYNSIWTINSLEDSQYGKIGIDILVEHRDPLVVEVNTVDKITNRTISGAEYKVEPSLELAATTTPASPNVINVGYVNDKGVYTYKLTQTAIPTSYQGADSESFRIEYENETIKNAQMVNASTENKIEKTAAKRVRITIYVEPKVPFEISNLYYFDNNIKLQGANFEVTSLRNQDTATGTTDANGMTSMYSDIFGKEDGETVIYKLRQTKAAVGYGTVDDFYVKVTYNADREITDAILTDIYGEPLENDNRFVNVSFRKSTSGYNGNNKGIVTIEVKNYPEFKFNIRNVDRRDGTTPIVGTQYSVTSTYTDSDNNIIDFTKTTEPAITNDEGIGIAHLDKTRDNTVVTYTIKEDIPATNYQSLGTDIKVIVTFDENGYVSNVEVENHDNLYKIESASKVEPIEDDRDRFTVNVILKNNPILRFNITKLDSIDKETKINEVGFTIVSQMDGQVYSNSSATNKVNQTETPEMSALTGYLNGEDGYTEMYMDRTVDNRDMFYTIREAHKAPGYEWVGEDIVLKITYDENGKIASQPVATQGGPQVKVLEIGEDKFTVNLEIYNEEIKQFGIHLSAVDAYDSNKKINDLKVEAWLVEQDDKDHSYSSDGKYELLGENALLTGSDADNDGRPDIAYGEDYKVMGAYEEGAGTRLLRLAVTNNSDSNGGYYLDSEGNTVGYYRGTTHVQKAYYERIRYQTLIYVDFDDDGKITGARLRTGENADIGWLTDAQYIQTEDGTLKHTNYRLNITLKLYPMFNLNLFGMDNYTYQDEVETNKKPNALPNGNYRISTQRHTSGRRYHDEYVTAGYIGAGHLLNEGEAKAYGNIYEGINSLYVPIEIPNTANGEVTKSRTYYVFEEGEPTNYQQHRKRYSSGADMNKERLVAVITVEFDQYAEMNVDSWKFIDRTDATGPGSTELEDGTIVNGENATYYYRPYQGEDGGLLAHDNLQEYNYWYSWTDSDTISTLTNRTLDFYIGYALTTKITVRAVDEISGAVLPGIRMYPFINQTYCTNLPYSYSSNEKWYRDTGSDGRSGWVYWGAAEANNSNEYIIGSGRKDNLSNGSIYAYNGYLLPPDMASEGMGGSGNAQDYYARLDVLYDNKGKISTVNSLGADLWGDNNATNITWDRETGNVYVDMLYSRKFQMTLYKQDYYDETINTLNAAFDVISDRGLKTSINARSMAAMGKVYKNTTVKYTLSETQVPDGYYPLNLPVSFYVTFDKNGNIGKKSIKSDSDYFTLINTSETTEGMNKTSPDLSIGIKNKPAFTLDLRIIDKFYKDDGVGNIQLNISNNKGDTIIGNPETDSNGYSKVIAGPIHPGEEVIYYISQRNKADEYYMNYTQVQLKVKFTDSGKIEEYSIISGNDVVNDFNTTKYMNTRQVSIQIMNIPENLKLGFKKYDGLTGNGIAGVNFTITKQQMPSGAKSEVKLVTGDDGTVIQNLDTFVPTGASRVIKYTIHEDETPDTYRKIQDSVILVYYNADGSINSWHKTNNDDGALNEDVNIQVAIGKIKRYQDTATPEEPKDTRVHMIAEIPNDNAYDIVIKNEDSNVENFGIEGSEFDVSINENGYPVQTTDVNGRISINKLTEAGDITIRVGQRKVGDGYADDINNNVEVKVNKAATGAYSLKLKADTAGYVDEANATTEKATITVDEEHGVITVVFKNETKAELTVIKQEKNTRLPMKDTQFEIIGQQVDNRGNAIQDSTPVTLTANGNDITGEDGKLYFDLGVAPRNEIWEYTFNELTAPEGYKRNVGLKMTVTYDQNGRMTIQTPQNQANLTAFTEHPDNKNCRSIYAIIYGDNGKATYTVKVVTEDAETGKRISGSNIYMNITKADTENGEEQLPIIPATPASAQNGQESLTGNLGIDGAKYTDAQVEDKNIPTPVILERGLTYIDNIDYEGTVNIEVSQRGYANGYIKGSQKVDGSIKIKATHIPQADGTEELEFAIIDNGGFGDAVRVNNANRVVTITIKNESQVTFKILTREYKAQANEETKGIPDVKYSITAEIQRATSCIATDVTNVETQLSTDPEGLIIDPIGHAFAGETVVYTIHQILPEISNYDEIDDIKIEVQYDSKGYIKYYELLTSEDNALIVEPETKDRFISLEITNYRTINGYRLFVEKHAMDTDDDELAYGTTLPGAKFRITIEQQVGKEHSEWIEVTDDKGQIKLPALNGYGFISVVIEELEAPEGYTVSEIPLRFTLHRDKRTGNFEKIEGNVNIEDIDITNLDEFGNVIIQLKPIDSQKDNKFTMVVNKYSIETNRFITTDSAEFTAELVRKDEEGNITYSQTIDNFYTDENGKATIDNLDMPGEEGEYKLVITERKAPEGYEKLSEPVEIPVTFKQKEDGNLRIYSVNPDGLENVSISKVNEQLIGINIGNNMSEGIGENEYSLDITKVDAETNDPIEDMAIFKVWLPDDKNTSVYTETMETLLGPGKLDYCYIEQDKDYQIRLAHMQLPKEPGTLKYVFKEVVAPEGYAKAEEDLELSIEFAIDEETGEMYIANAISSNEEYLRINTETPCTTQTRLSIDILNHYAEQTKFTVHYDANDNGEGTVVPEDQIKDKDVDLKLSTSIPTREGYTFEGWATLPTATEPNFKPGDMYTLNQDITLYAIWQEQQDEFELTINPNGGKYKETTENSIENGKTGDTITLETPEAPNGHTVTLDPNYEGAPEQDSIIQTVIFSKWVKESGEGTISGNVYTFGEGDGQVKAEYIENSVQLPIPEEREGYEFDGWYTDPTGGTKIDNPDTYIPTDDTTLYAHWKKKDKLWLSSDVYKIGDNDIDNYEYGDIYIEKIMPETTVKQFIANCKSNGNITVINEKGEALNDDDLVGTNMTIKVTGYGEEFILTAVVMGDLDGNGLVTVTDLSGINQAVLKVIKLEGAVFKAADLDDNNEITVTDLSGENQKILKVIDFKYDKKLLH